MGCETQLKTVLCFRRSWFKRPWNRIGYDRSYSNFEYANTAFRPMSTPEPLNYQYFARSCISFLSIEKTSKKVRKNMKDFERKCQWYLIRTRKNPLLTSGPFASATSQESHLYLRRLTKPQPAAVTRKNLHKRLKDFGTITQ